MMVSSWPTPTRIVPVGWGATRTAEQALEPVLIFVGRAESAVTDPSTVGPRSGSGTGPPSRPGPHPHNNNEGDPT